MKLKYFVAVNEVMGQVSIIASYYSLKAAEGIVEMLTKKGLNAFVLERLELTKVKEVL